MTKNSGRYAYSVNLKFHVPILLFIRKAIHPLDEAIHIMNSEKLQRAKKHFFIGQNVYIQIYSKVCVSTVMSSLLLVKSDSQYMLTSVS